jgi:hypothetical protein
MALEPAVMLLYTRTFSSVDLRIFCSLRLHRHELGIQLSPHLVHKMEAFKPQPTDAGPSGDATGPN